MVGKQASTLKFSVTKEGGSFDALTGSTISSRAYANAVESAYAGYLWAKGRLETDKQSDNDTASGASTTQYDNNTETEPEAQKGEVENE